VIGWDGRSHRAFLPADPGLGAARARKRRAHASRVRRSERPSLPLAGPLSRGARRADSRSSLDAGHQELGGGESAEAAGRAQRERELRVLFASRPIRAERAARSACRFVPHTAWRWTGASYRSVRRCFSPRAFPCRKEPLIRLAAAHDTGGAIRGVVRADFFWGTGAEAGHRGRAHCARTAGCGSSGRAARRCRATTRVLCQASR